MQINHTSEVIVEELSGVSNECSGAITFKSEGDPSSLVWDTVEAFRQTELSISSVDRVGCGCSRY